MFQIQVCTRQTNGRGFTPEEPQGSFAEATDLGPVSRSQLEGKDPVVKWGRYQTEYWLGGGADQFFPSADPQGRGDQEFQQAGGGGSSRQREGL